MITPAYPPARAVAGRVEAHFTSNRDEAEERGLKGLAPHPRADVIESVINTAFWASLRREEGRDPQISLAYLPPERAGQPMIFERPVPFAADAIARLAPAVVRPGIHLGVWPSGGELWVWGAARLLPCLCFVLEVVEPGLLVVKYRRGEGFVKFGNVAVLRGEEVKIVDERVPGVLDYPPVLTSLLRFDSNMTLHDAAAVLMQLCVSMRGHGHGGALLVTPAGSRSWHDSAVWPIPYLFDPPLTEISGLLHAQFDEQDDQAYQEQVHRAADAIAGLTAVDGATVINTSFDVLAFGVKMRRATESTPISQLILSEPVEGETQKVVLPTQVGGTRHLSAAQFAHDQHDAFALVASQDGRFTVFAWSPSQHMVHAHKIESLLL